MINLIGLAGKAGSGKDTAGQMLCNHIERGGHADRADLYALAAPLKAAAASLFQWDVVQLNCWSYKEALDPNLGFTRREGLQRIGDCLRREFGDNLFVTLLEYQLDKDSSVFPIITDVRGEHEAAMIRNSGGIIIKLERDGAGLQGTLGHHHTEAGLPAAFIDYTIYNNGTKEQLSDKLRSLVQGVFK